MEFTKADLEFAGCLRRLLKARFLLRSRNEKWFQAVIDYRLKLQKHFEALALELEINEALGVAYLKPLQEELEESIAYQMGRKQTLSPLASAIVYRLRHHRLQFYLNPTNDSAPLITWEDMREFVQAFNVSKIDSQFERAVRKALEELLELQIVTETKPGSGIYEISPICEILLPLDQIRDGKVKMEAYFTRNGFRSDSKSDDGVDASADLKDGEHDVG